jgi:TonB family protein
MRISFSILILWSLAAFESSAQQSTQRDHSAVTNYLVYVQKVYEHEWASSQDGAKGDRVVKASIVVAKDGTVLSAKITSPSGDNRIDSSVEEVLHRVRHLQPFASGAKEDRRTFTVAFALGGHK